MRVVIPSIQTPFMRGGAYFQVLNLKNALIEHGHTAEIVSFPFKFFPNSHISELMDYTSNQNFHEFTGHFVDKVIALQFPAYYIQHPNKTIWLMHQHRAVYDLYPQMEKKDDIEILQEKIIDYDNKYIGCVNNIFADSQTVADRLKKFNNIDATPLYHPPSDEDKFYCDTSYDYVFYPSRVEKLKRQDLLIEAMQYTKTNIKAIIAGSGGEYQNFQKLIEKLGIGHKVKLIGEISQAEKFTFYANSLAVVFPPVDEDYGYITLEAMLSSKPVLTCTDSGGVLEFIRDGEAGWVVEPNPKELAQKLDWFYENRGKTEEMGRLAKEIYLSKDISWSNVVSKLL